MKLVGRLKLAEVKEKGFVRMTYPPFDVLVAYEAGQVYAIEDACNHAGASLAEGWVEDGCAVCPMHGYVFDLKDGKLLRPRGLCADQRTYTVRIEGEDVVVTDHFQLVIV
ncbi:MAG: 3-phenylpropionate dioxygenase ferredoxin subunit [Labilithrix sp.]|nr:3-phenylpropionate dioxygenase ferredoxin subunit [Labilithrix sp.]